MQVLDLQSLKQVSDDVGGSTMQTQRTGLMHVSPAENAVRVETVVLAGGHRDEMAADGVVATVLDLSGRRPKMSTPVFQRRKQETHIMTHLVECVWYI